MLKNILILFLFLLVGLLPAFSFAQTSKSIGADILEVGNANSSSDPKIKFPGTNNELKADKATGKLQFTNDGSVWKNFGSGSGSGASGQTFNINGTLEDGFAVSHSYTSGVATEVSGTANALEGEKSVLIDFTAENDYYHSDFFTIPKGLYGSACELKFKYRDGGANTFVRVENEAGVVLGRYQRPESGSVVYGLQALSSPGYESVYFKCPTQADVTASALNGKIRYVVYQGTSTDAAAITMDLFSLGELSGLAEATTPDAFGGYISNTGSLASSYGGAITGCSLSSGIVTCLLNGLSAGPICTVTVNDNSTSSLIAKLRSITASSVSFSILNASNTVVASDANISCHKQGADAKQSIQVFKSIPKLSSHSNSFPLWLQTGAGGTAPVVIFDPYSIVSTYTRIGAGVYTVTFGGSVFSTNPTVVCSTSEQTVEIDSIAPTSFNFQTRNAAGSGTDLAGTAITCTVNRNDIVMPTVQPIVIGQVTNSAAESGIQNVRVEACFIANSGAATIFTGSGLCESWVASVARNSAGVVTVTPKAGIFSADPVCSGSTQGGSGSSMGPVRIVSSTSSSIQTSVVNTAGTSTDYNFFFSCMGKR